MLFTLRPATTNYCFCHYNDKNLFDSVSCYSNLRIFADELFSHIFTGSATLFISGHSEHDKSINENTNTNQEHKNVITAKRKDIIIVNSAACARVTTTPVSKPNCPGRLSDDENSNNDDDKKCNSKCC